MSVQQQQIPTQWLQTTLRTQKPQMHILVQYNVQQNENILNNHQYQNAWQETVEMKKQVRNLTMYIPHF